MAETIQVATADQPTGDFYLTKNRYRKTNNSAHMKGTHTKPGSDVDVQTFAWAHEFTDTKTGEIRVCFTGTLGEGPTAATPDDQLRAMTDAASRGETIAIGKLNLAPRTFALFPNSFKDEPTKSGKPRHDLYGWVNPGDGTPAYRIAVWTKSFDDGHVYLSGNTQYPQPGKSEREQQDAAIEVEELAVSGKVGKGTSKKARGGRGE